MGQIQSVIDTIMSAAVTLSGDSNKNQAPYYYYGSKRFNTNESVAPQVKWNKTDFSVFKSEQRGGVPLGLNNNNTNSGSIGTVFQNVECTIWGENEQQCLNEFGLICRAINYIKGTYNPENISQLPLQDTITGEWVDDSAHLTQGEMLRFNYVIKYNIAETQTSSSMILSASFGLTGSYGISVNGSTIPTGSYGTISGSKEVTIWSGHSGSF